MNLLKKSSNLILILLLISIARTENNREFRATWLITWEHQCDSSKIKNILDQHKAANMNAVFFQIRQGGTVYYNSSYEPWGKYVDYEDPGYDPLEFAIKEAHKRGLELHAWFNTFQTSSNIEGAPAEKHPDWVCRDGNGNAMPEKEALSPGLEAVRDYTNKVAMEIVKNYNIDGLHLDYIRWNEYTTSTINESVLAKETKQERLLDGMISELVLQGLKDSQKLKKKEKIEDANPDRYLYDKNHSYSEGIPDGYSSWPEWWRSSVTKFVKTLHDSIQVNKPWVKLSTAVLGKYDWGGWQGYSTVFQDGAKWYNKEYIDQLTPMHYHWTTASGFSSMLSSPDDQDWDHALSDTSEALFTVGPGSYVLDQQGVWDNHNDIIQECRKFDWVDGFQFFSYAQWNDYDYFSEAGHTIFSNSTKIPFNYNNPGATPTSPNLSLQKEDSLNYSISVESQESNKKWYVIYRSEDQTIEPNSDEIIEMRFTKTPFTYQESFSGNQTYDGKYYYGATRLNRYWSESDVSDNIGESDKIPSLPPKIVSATPNEEDTVPPTSQLTFEFSKVMDFSNFKDAFSITPDAKIETISVSDKWYNEGKIVTVSLSEQLGYNTTYEIKIDSSLTDANNVLLDGNGDGSSGDSYSSLFYTNDKDTEGPKVVNSYPSDKTYISDPDDIWIIEFDELIDPQSLGKNDITITNDGKALESEFIVTNNGNTSNLNIKTPAQLKPDSDLQINISTGLTDTAGNPIKNAIDLSTQIGNYHYSEKAVISDFSSDWWQPSGSGSTEGIKVNQTSYNYNQEIYVPGINSQGSGEIKYEWDLSADNHFLRDHLDRPDDSQIEIDTGYTIQCFIHGDGSQNKFRFSLYEKNGGNVAEVSKWKTIDWEGWRLVEWDLSDTSTIGYWSDDLSNGKLDGEYYVFESLQMKKSENGSTSGKIYFDELRIAKKEKGTGPKNYPPVVESLSDTTMKSDETLTRKVNYSDKNTGDKHKIIPIADTTDIKFKLTGHEPGSRLYIIPEDNFEDQATIKIIVKDYGVGALADTATFNLNVQSTGVATDQNIAEFKLSQNYPNPFNPTTNIDYHLKSKSEVTLSIFNILGQLVKKKELGYKTAGKYTVQINASNLPSGTYIYRLKAGNKFSDTRKMILLK